MSDSGKDDIGRLTGRPVQTLDRMVRPDQIEKKSKPAKPGTPVKEQ